MKKKLLRLAFLSLVGLALSASASQAGFFRNLCCNRCATHIVVRPYNAFTPFCYGNMVCDGCCPTPFCASGCGPGGSGCGPAMAPLAVNYGFGCQQSPMLYPGAPGSPVLLPGNPGYAPGYAPMPAAPVNNTTYLNQQPYGVQPAGYNPGYAYPGYGYYPQQPYPMNNYYQQYQQMPSPYYWYQGR